MTDWNVGSGSRNDLFVEAVQMTKGHIGFGAYRALHHDGDEVDLLESGDVNNEVDDEASLPNSDSFSDDESQYHHAYAMIVAEELGYYKYEAYLRNEGNHLSPRKEKNLVSVRKKPACYETVSSAHHRIQAWLVDETSKYPIFCGHLRIT